MVYKKHYKKIFVGAAALFIIFMPVGVTTQNPAASPAAAGGGHVAFHFAISPSFAFATSTTSVVPAASTAQLPDPEDCADNLATCGVYFAAILINGIMAGALSLFALLVQLGLQFNDNVFNSPAVQTGFSVSLAIANLGFVLGIIIIAIATIIRNQTYGIKQLLWKLVMMAVLVNFGLVITAPIVGFANDMSQYFINATSPSAATGGYYQYVLTITSAFEPQTTLNAPSASTTGSSFLTTICQESGGVTGSAAIAAFCAIKGVSTNPQPNDVFWQQTMALIFDVAFLGVAVFVFMCLSVLLIIRYLMLGGLLIVLPLAWLTYVFPKFDNSYSKWWNTFIKWTLFPPIALFFIYLAFITAVTTTAPGTNGATPYAVTAIGGTGGGTQNTGIIQNLATETGLTGGVFEQFADEVLLLGLMIMGLMFANSLSGKAGSTVVNGAKGASKAIGGYVGKKGLRVAGRAVPQKLKEGLQAGRVPLVPQRLQVAAGVGLGRLERKGRSDMVAEEAQHAETLAKDPQQFARIIAGKAGALGTGATSRQRQMAMLAQLAKDEDLQKEVAKQGNMVGGKHLQEFLKDNEGEFKRLQQDKLYETLKDKSGLTPLQLAQKNEGAQKTVQELEKKKHLDEVRGVLQSANDPETVGEFSEEQKNILKRKKDLEYAKNTGEITEAESAELDEMRKAEKSHGSFMSPEEKQQYQKAKDEFTETNNKLKAWVAKNPDVAADSFQDHDRAVEKLKAEGKPVPLTFDPVAVKQLQKSMLTAMAEGFSPQNAKGLIEAVGKKNNLKYLEESMDKMDKDTVAQIRSLAAANKPLATWISKNPGKNMVDLNQMFGIAEEKRKKNRRDEDEEDT